ncbi:MAG TPA: ribbon-helix-helix protein, CopG family [Candidatus Cloacimonetes bacterium]|nr:ribbon-helix-helix protein, CopG family [Candidatus Cloacimonadota bacterium]
MNKMKVAITLDEHILVRLDRLVKQYIFPNRSQAIQEAIEDKLKKIDQNRLATESAKLDPEYEQAIAEEGFSAELSEWPEY